MKIQSFTNSIIKVVVAFVFLFTCSAPTHALAGQCNSVSPFGVLGPSEYSFDPEWVNAGVGIVRFAGGVSAWDKIEPAPGQYNWEHLDRNSFKWHIHLG